MLRTSLRTDRARILRQFSTTKIAWNSSSSSPRSSGSSSSEQKPPASPPSSNSASPSTNTPEDRTFSDHSTSPNRTSTFLDLNTLRDNFRKWSDEAAINFRQKADDFTGSTKVTFSQLGSQLNKVTGYDEIEALKRQVVEQEARIKEARRAARQAKLQYQQAVFQRSNSQRELNDLLQRKSSWTDHDVSRFTTLVREDHTFVQEEARSKAAVDETEEAVEKEFNELTRSILTRYHEEQVWSDKIRSASTYGQLAALGLNLLVFILAIVAVEPWKRRRLAQTFEKKIEEMEVEYKTAMEEHMGEVQRHLNGQAAVLGAIAGVVERLDTQLQQTKEVTVPVVDEPVLPPSIWAKAVKDRHFTEAVATGAVAATVLSAIGWIWLGG
ncbi:mitochondrial inner membrane protein [Moniliophthora roreri MCA 2997]|uniref:Sensitive to high expression protein 9, mitochondrial n=2 Tax=Moniliophthora roreri TaxID=221103 RepID=V2WTU4_MONRO|nr:mitochondrial inner membrane protein [Moniliophthora roreri MCA 2997]KAI3603096.1 mitochondrial inner membrane protein [Moniliophthora roreri]